MTDYKAIRDLTCTKCNHTYPIVMAYTYIVDSEPTRWTLRSAMPHGPTDDRCVNNTWIDGETAVGIE